jgi:C4-dicarboxylate-specific signal transduction histidine kinase
MEKDKAWDRPQIGGADDAAAARPLRTEDLVYINRMTTVGHVLPSVAHELNNALQVIGGLVELLGMRQDLSKDAQDKIQKIGAQAVRSAGMIRDFVAYARRDETTGRVEMNKALERALAMRRYHLSRSRIDLTVDPSPGPLLVTADSQHVVQVLLNLIINAEEAVVGTDRRTLRVALVEQPDNVRCEVHDSGSGFSDTALRALRQPFTTTKPKGAAGLGLAVASALVEQDRGRLLVLDGPGGCIAAEWPKASPVEMGTGL